jgi:ABC-2 type transport system ATP-binding protein
MLCTLLTPTAGTAEVAGFDVVHQRDDVRRHIGLVFQDQTLDGYLTTEMNLRLHGELYGVPKAVLLDRIERMLKMVGLWERRGTSIWTYIQKLKATEDITMFITTHYMDEAEYCDRIAITDDGRIIALDTPEALKASVGKDRIRITTDDDPETIRLIEQRFGLDATMSEPEITFSSGPGAPVESHQQVRRSPSAAFD